MSHTNLIISFRFFQSLTHFFAFKFRKKHLPNSNSFLPLSTIWLNYMVKEIKINTEEKILEAAQKVFITKGMSGARMQDIANEAGINKAMLHYYFKDKEKLFETVFLQEAQKFFPKINTIFQSDAPLFEKIENFVSEYIDEIQQNPYLPLFVLTEINRDPDQFMYKIWGKENLPKPAKFLQQIEAEVQKGTIKKIDPKHLLMNLLSMTIFPFVARPMLTRNLRMSEPQFKQAMEERKKEIPKFIIDAIRN